MIHAIGRRAGTAAATLAITAGTLLAAGGAASAAPPADDHRSGAVSAPVRTAAGPNADQRDAAEGRARVDSDHRYHDGPGDRVRDHHRDGYRVSVDDARRQWVLDQVYWTRDHVSVDDARRQWVLDQVYWMRDHG
ncbi:hypothetical protein ABZS88_45140 [Streptomyces sp. NPDC005480]|uniref:hypothetical protein n=1 Tax=Streptomyces sp. NPDC005480 TaxID=3154880 RepID=UPI0033AE5018